jgi:hypothetical protein
LSLLEIITPNLCTFAGFEGANPIVLIISPAGHIIAIISFSLIIFMDFYFFWKERGFKLKEYFITSDPFAFRIEIYLDMVVIIITFVLTIWFPLDYFRVKYITPATNQSGAITRTLIAVLLFLANLLLLFVFSCFGLIVSWIKMIQKGRKLKIEEYESEFEAFISHPKGKEIFKKYAKSEWSLENLFCQTIFNFLADQILNLN